MAQDGVDVSARHRALAARYQQRPGHVGVVLAPVERVYLEVIA
jgi:hypothetical protein